MVCCAPQKSAKAGLDCNLLKRPAERLHVDTKSIYAFLPTNEAHILCLALFRYKKAFPPSRIQNLNRALIGPLGSTAMLDVEISKARSELELDTITP